MFNSFIDSLNRLQQIYVVFVAFVLLAILWAITRDTNVFTLANTALGAVIGLAMKTSKPTFDTDKIETVNVSGGNPAESNK